MYTGQSPLLGHGQANAATIDAWFRKNGFCPPGLGMAIISTCSTEGINSDLVAAQCAHESAYWTSDIARDKNNPAGIGAENDDPYGKAVSFPSVSAGIQAQVYHLLTYVKGAGYWGISDPRYAAVKAAGWLGSVKVLSDLDGKWAYPGVGYGVSIASRANNLLASGGTTVSAGDDNRFAWIPDTSEFGYPQGTHGRNGQPIELFILHITVGTDSLSWLNGNNGSSAHYLTDAAGRPRAQMVSEADAAWTPGSRDYALRSINGEVEMLHVTDWTDAIMREVARTVAPILARNSIPAVYLGRDNGPGKKGLIGHRDVPDGQGGWGGSGHHDDPGANFDWPTFIGYLASNSTVPPSPTDPLTMPDLDPVKRDGFTVPFIFGAFWDTRGGLEIFGHFVSGVIEERQRLVQYTERARFEYVPDIPGGVQLGLLGLEVLAGRHPDLI